MTEPLTCSEARDLAPEVALGIAEARERARLLGHVAACTECQALVGRLSRLVDDLVALAPAHEPPAGFESRVLAEATFTSATRTGSAARIRPGSSLRSRVRALALGAAACVAAAAVAGGYVHIANQPDRELAASVRAALATANGQYFVAAPLQDGSGTKRGSVFAYQGNPAWLFINVQGPLEPGTYGVDLVTRNGDVRHLAQVDLHAVLSWGGSIPVAVHDVSAVRIIRDDKSVLSAKILLP